MAEGVVEDIPVGDAVGDAEGDAVAVRVRVAVDVGVRVRVAVDVAVGVTTTRRKGTANSDVLPCASVAVAVTYGPVRPPGWVNVQSPAVLAMAVPS